MRPENHSGAILVFLEAVRPINDAAYVLLDRFWRGRISVHTTPDWRSGERLQINACDDSEVASTSTKGDPEVCIFIGVRVDNLAACKNHFEVSDVVADETFLIKVKGETAAQN